MRVEHRFLEDYETGEVRVSMGRTVTEADIVNHAGQTGDFFPQHMDAEWMKSQPGGQRIAHGTLILSVSVGMTASDINPESISYGYDRIRFIKPVFIGDTITVRATISDKRPHKKSTEKGLLIEDVEVTNQRGQIVLAFQHLYLVNMKDENGRNDYR